LFLYSTDVLEPFQGKKLFL